MNDVCGKLCERRQNYVGKRKRILSDLSAWLLWRTIWKRWKIGVTNQEGGGLDSSHPEAWRKRNIFSPVFESDTHGYNTRDYTKIDCRLGTNEDFKEVVDKLHAAGIKVVLDGVFNHVGRGFWAFQDVLKNRWDSPYKDWFHISFDGNSNYNDGLWYEGWEGNFDLVKLNLRNEKVIQHILSCVKAGSMSSISTVSVWMWHIA